MTRFLSLTSVLLGLAMLCLLGTAPVAVADEAASVETLTAEAVAEQNADSTPYTAIDSLAGLRVYVDANGNMRQPTVEEQKAFRSAMGRMMETQRRIAPRVPTKSANGTLSMVLGLDGLSFSVLHYHADGTQSRACVDAHQIATEPLDTLVAPRGNGREEM